MCRCRLDTLWAQRRGCSLNNNHHVMNCFVFKAYTQQRQTSRLAFAVHHNRYSVTTSGKTLAYRMFCM